MGENVYVGNGTAIPAKNTVFLKKNQRGLRNCKIWRGTPWTNEKVAFGHHIRRSMKDHAVFHIDLGWLVIQNKVDWKRGSKCTHLCTFYCQLIIKTSSVRKLPRGLHYNTMTEGRHQSQSQILIIWEISQESDQASLICLSFF